MYHLRSALLVVIITLPLHSAPVPPYRPKPPITLAPGTWSFTWSGTPTTIILRDNGKHEYTGMWSTYRGTWLYDAKCATLHVHETCDGTTWCSWSVRLIPGKDGNTLEGMAKYQQHETAVTLKRK